MIDGTIKDIVEKINSAKLFEDDIALDQPQEAIEEELREIAEDLTTEDEDVLDETVWKFLYDEDYIDWIPECLKQASEKQTPAKPKTEQASNKTKPKAEEKVTTENKQIINTEVLRNAVKQCMSATSPRAMFPGSDCIKLCKEGLVTFNGTCGVVATLTLDIECVVNAKQFQKIINVCPDDTVMLSLTDKELMVSSGSYKSGLALFNQEINLPKVDVGDTKALDESFMEQLKEALVYTLPSDPQLLSFVCVNNGYVIASDKKRAIVQTTDNGLENNPLYLTQAHVKILENIDPKAFGQQGNLFIFYGDMSFAIIPAVKGDFPDVYGKVVVPQLEDAGVTTIPTPPPELLARLKAVDDDKMLQVVVDDDSVEYSVRSQNVWTSEKVDNTGSTPHTFCVNIDYFMQASKLFEQYKVTPNAMLFTDGVKHVAVALMKK